MVVTTFGPLTDSDGELVTDSRRIAILLNNHFFSVFNLGSLPTTTINTSYDNSINDNSIHTLPSFAITTDEMLNALPSLKTNKSPRPDTVYPLLVKETKSELLYSLTSLHLFAAMHHPFGLLKLDKERFRKHFGINLDPVYFASRHHQSCVYTLSFLYIFLC